MTKFNPEKLTLKYRDGVTMYQPIVPRLYTLIHSDLIGELFLYIGCHNVLEKRLAVFRRELPLALQAIRYGDRQIFNTYPYLNDAPIIVTFLSSYPQYASQENW